MSRRERFKRVLAADGAKFLQKVVPVLAGIQLLSSLSPWSLLATHLCLIQLPISKRQIIMPARKCNCFLARDTATSELKWPIADPARVQIKHRSTYGSLENGDVLSTWMRRSSITWQGKLTFTKIS